MDYKFFLLDKNDAKDGTRIGYAYAKANESKWITKDSSTLRDYLTIGFVKGCDHIVYEDKVYSLMKTYTNIEDGYTLFIGVESIAGCDNKKVFNNLDRSTIIVDKKKKEDEVEDDQQSGTVTPPSGPEGEDDF